MESQNKLLYFVVVPLIVVSGFVVIVNQKPSNWFWISSGVHSRQFKSDAAAPAPPRPEAAAPAPSRPEAAAPAPPQPEAAEKQQPVLENEDEVRIGRKKYSNLEQIEASLAQSRSRIRKTRLKNETLHDPDYVPNGPMYWNPSEFHRSYLEMEKKFKIYVYEEGDPPVFHYSSMEGILGIEGILISDIEISKFRTKNREKAHVYFLPISFVSIWQFVFQKDNRAWTPLQNVASDYVNQIALKYPYWNRSLGHDHFILACHDWAPIISSAIPYLYKNSIRVLCNANTSEGFNLTKDVSLPEIYLPKGNMDGLLGGPPPSKRSILVFYSGGIHGYIREVLMKEWKDKDPDVQVSDYLPKNMNYYDMFRKSKYCICPSGWEVASPRMVEGLYTGCVPVLLKAHYAKPFSDVLDWSTFSVDISVEDIPNLKKILMAIPQEKYIKMQRAGVLVRRHFEVNMPPKRYDVFHMILHSIWLRRLNIQVHDTSDI